MSAFRNVSIAAAAGGALLSAMPVARAQLTINPSSARDGTYAGESIQFTGGGSHCGRVDPGSKPPTIVISGGITSMTLSGVPALFTYTLDGTYQGWVDKYDNVVFKKTPEWRFSGLARDDGFSISMTSSGGNCTAILNFRKAVGVAARQSAAVPPAPYYVGPPTLTGAMLPVLGRH